ncbi:MAG TPA: AgmX/PglI C-terminal domain-containing protein, partial [Polyangiaceae bacterium]|nr:AgmX/PglI C-terminal domain-containing protein [Polyangiaceae bacterium]
MWLRMCVLAATTSLGAAEIAHAEPDAGATLRALAAASTRSAVAPGTVTAEAVYPSGERPRADGPVQASVADEDLARWNVGGTSDGHFPSNRPGFHVAPRVKVDVSLRPGQLPFQSSRKGVLSETAVLAQSRNHGYWPFRICFEAGLRKDPKLRGKSRLHAVIEPSGHVRAARVVASELDDHEVARCVVARAETLK